MAIEPELEQRISTEVDRMAEILDKDTPPISFEEAKLLDLPAHTGFRDDTLLISPSSLEQLTFDQLRTSIAYTLAVAVQFSQMYRRTKTAWAIGALTTIAIVALAATYGIFYLVPMFGVVCGLLFIRTMKQRSWRRISETDALVYRLVGDIQPVIEYIKTKGYWIDAEDPHSQSEMVARRIAALQTL